MYPYVFVCVLGSYEMGRHNILFLLLLLATKNNNTKHSSLQSDLEQPPQSLLLTVSLYSKQHSRMHACSAVTCHLHFWQNDWDLLRATAAVTRGWNGFRNKSQHRKSTLENKIRPPLLPGLEPGTFLSRSSP